MSEAEMKKRSIGLFVFLTCFSLLPLPGRVGGREKTLEENPALKQCVREALSSNSDLLLASAASSRNLIARKKAFSLFWPRFEFDVDHQESTAPSVLATETGGAANLITSKTLEYSATLSETLPTGTELFTSFATIRTDTSSSNALISPYYYSYWELGGTQKLLKGFDWFGSQMGNSWADLRVASRRKDVSRAELSAKVSETVRQVEQAFWTLVAQKEIVEARRNALEITQKQYEVTQKKIKSGISVAASLYEVEERLASRKGDLLMDLQELARSKVELERVIGLEEGKAFEDHYNVPNEIAFKEFSLSQEGWLKRIKAENDDVIALREELEAKRMEKDRDRNLLLPTLDLEGSFFLEGGNSATNVGAQGSYSGDLSELLDTRSTGWQISAKLEVPLGPSPDWNDYKLSKLEYKMARLALEKKWREIRQTALETMSEIEMGKEIVASAQKTSRLAEKKLKFEQERFESGLTPGFNVLAYQEDLTLAQINEVRALLAYKKSVAMLQSLTGDLLKKFQIVIGEKEGEWKLSSSSSS